MKTLILTNEEYEELQSVWYCSRDEHVFDDVSIAESISCKFWDVSHTIFEEIKPFDTYEWKISFKPFGDYEDEEETQYFYSSREECDKDLDVLKKFGKTKLSKVIHRGSDADIKRKKMYLSQMKAFQEKKAKEYDESNI